MYLTCAFVGDGGRSQNRAKHVQIYFIRPRILYVVGGGPRPWADNRNPRESARDLADLGRLVRLALSNPTGSGRSEEPGRESVLPEENLAR